MPEHYWVDTNVILRFITQSPDEHAKLATKVMEKVEAGHIVLHVHPIIIAECCYVLEGRLYKLPHGQIANILRELILSEGIEAEQESILLRAIDHYEQYRIDFEDAFLAAYANSHSHHNILTFNTKDFANTPAESYSPLDVAGLVGG